MTTTTTDHDGFRSPADHDDNDDDDGALQPVQATPSTGDASNAPVAGVSALQGCVAALAPSGTL